MTHSLLLPEFDTLEYAVLGVLSVSFLVHLFFYIFFYGKPCRRGKKKAARAGEHDLPSVSVIITATDESENLAECLPVILNQEYPDYEVIVVNNGLTDDTDMLLKGLKPAYPHLYDTFLPKHEGTQASRRKLAMTVGIKAAKKDVLLFTEADSIPLGKHWIASMMNELSDDKDVVLGYCAFMRAKKFMNRIAGFDNLLYSLQYLSCALFRKPYTGTYRNVAYRKELFFDNRGFSLFLNYEYSDGIFLNYIMSSKNTAVALSRDSFVSTRLNSFAKWKNIKVYHYKIKDHFRNFKLFSRIFSMETANRYLFYLLIFCAGAYSIFIEKWAFTILLGLLFLLRLLTGIVIINKSARYFRDGRYRFSYMLVDLLQPVYNLYFRMLRTNERR